LTRGGHHEWKRRGRKKRQSLKNKGVVPEKGWAITEQKSEKRERGLAGWNKGGRVRALRSEKG